MPASLNSISPLDGRYYDQVQELASIFSEQALMKYRLQVEIEYLIALSKEPKIKELKSFSEKEITVARKLYQNFSDNDAKKVKQIEKRTDHDVKALEYFAKEELTRVLPESAFEFFHFALTSEDINNLAYAFALRDGLKVYSQNIQKLLSILGSMAKKFRSSSMLSLTHGQPATPTTLGKELAVFYFRLEIQRKKLNLIKLSGKFSGTTGNFAAHVLAYPNMDWVAFAKNFVEGLGLQYNFLTTQIEPHDISAEVFQILIRINCIIRDLDQDMWLYVMRGVFRQKAVKGETGSSTMPHKINPRRFENSEGNIKIANGILGSLAENLTVSRMQRDLSDSTLIRNQGIAIGYSLLAVKSTFDGFGRLDFDKEKAMEELENNPEVITEAVQTILRKVGYPKPYEAMKKLSRGKKISLKDLQAFVRSLKIPQEEKKKLLALTPEKYTGLAAKLVRNIFKFKI